MSAQLSTEIPTRRPDVFHVNESISDISSSDEGDTGNAEDSYTLTATFEGELTAALARSKIPPQAPPNSPDDFIQFCRIPTENEVTRQIVTTWFWRLRCNHNPPPITTPEGRKLVRAFVSRNLHKLVDLTAEQRRVLIEEFGYKNCPTCAGKHLMCTGKHIRSTQCRNCDAMAAESVRPPQPKKRRRRRINGVLTLTRCALNL